MLDDDGEHQNWNKLYLKSRAIKERELARSAKMKADAEEGRLIDAEQVQLEWASIGVILRQKIQGIPNRLSAQLAATCSASEARRLLQRELDLVLHEIADAVVAMDRAEE